MVETTKKLVVAWQAAVAAMLLLAGVATAEGPTVTYQPEPTAFCRTQTVHDFMRPFKRLPKLNAPLPDATLPFAPAAIKVKLRPPLIAEEGWAGFGLHVNRRAGTVPLDWTMKATFSRLDWKGRKLRTIEVIRRQIETMTHRDGAGGNFSMVRRPPGPYRLTVVFFDRAGNRIGGFGSYYRVVEPTIRPRLGLSASAYRPGSTVFARVENFGTVYLEVMAQIRIERLVGNSWTEAPESPGLHWDQPFIPEAGTAEGCTAFDIPPTMPPGRYRMVKELLRAVPPPGVDGSFLRYFSAAFDVLP